jgi:hypothetical protein
MLCLDPSRRLSLAAILASPWVRGTKLPPAAASAGAVVDASHEAPVYRSMRLPDAPTGQVATDELADEAAGGRARYAGGSLGGGLGGASAAESHWIEDDEPTYRSLGSVMPPSLSRQFAFGGDADDPA